MVKAYYSNLPLLWLLLIFLPLVIGNFGFIFLVIFISPLLKYLQLKNTTYTISPEGLKIKNYKESTFIPNIEIEGIYPVKADIKQKLLYALPTNHYAIVLKNGVRMPVAPRKDLCFSGAKINWCT